MARLALCLEYDGSPFQGWQKQPNKRTVQDCLEHAISRVADEKIQVVACGRTDTGVHALAQVVHFDTAVERSFYAWRKGTNSYLPDSISVLWCGQVSEDFHARYMARARTYYYIIHNVEARSAILYQRAGWCSGHLNIVAMEQAAKMLEGTHDFASFRASGCSAKTSIRTMYHVTVQQFGSFVCFRFCANAFLYRMVRNIMSVLLEIGQGKRGLDFMKQLLAHPTLVPHVPVSPSGLYLSGVRYQYNYIPPLICERNLPALFFQT